MITVRWMDCFVLEQNGGCACRPPPVVGPFYETGAYATDAPTLLEISLKKRPNAYAVRSGASLQIEASHFAPQGRAGQVQDFGGAAFVVICLDQDLFDILLFFLFQSQALLSVQTADAELP